MSRLLSGVLIILFILIVNIISAFVVQGTTETSSTFTDCEDYADAGDCDNVGKTAFLSTLADVTFTGFQDAPAVVNAVWLTMMGLMLSTAIILIVLAFIPLTSE